MSVLVHGEEKRESVVRELHGVGLEHREARAVGHDDVVGPPCARPLGVAEGDRVAQRRVGVAVAVRRPHAAAARPRSRHGRRRRVAGAVAVREGVPVRLGRALRSRPRALGAAAVRRAAALEGVAAACDRERPPEPPPPAARRAWLHCCDACDAGPNQECSVIFFRPLSFPGGLVVPGAAFLTCAGWRATPRVAFVLSSN